jgi:Ala-tRNA(Pro) deacylase
MPGWARDSTRERIWREAAVDGKATLEKYLRDNKVAHQFHHHPEAFTAQEVAAAEHVPGRMLAKVVIVTVGDGQAMVVVPAPEKIDLDKAASAAGTSEARLADEEEFRSLFTDCDTGAMPPFGNGTLYDLPVYVDEALAQQETIVFDACTHTDTCRLAYADFEALVKPSVVALT